MPNTNDYYQKREDPYKPKFTRNVNRPLTFFLVIVALVFIMSVFFKVSRIEVKGNSIYTADEVIKASGIETGDNLFFGKVTAIDMSDAANPTFEYDGRFLVKLGALDNTEYKFGKMLSAVSQLTADDAGTLDLSTGDKVVFNPN